MTPRTLVREGAQRLQRAGMPQAQHEAEWLLSHLLGTKPLELYVDDLTIPQPTVEQFFSHINARAAGAPVQYLLGEAQFCGERFAVGPGVFIPRPETEAIVEAALQALRAEPAKRGHPLRLIDVGTGSGCIALTLARSLPTCLVVGIEVSWQALRIARENVLRHGFSSRVRLVQGRWLEPIGGSVDGIISNPPYVPSAQVDCLPHDVRREPRLSLDGGEDGLRGLRVIIAQAPQVLRPGGILVAECGEDQVSELVRVASDASWVARARPLHDLAGRPRGILLTKAN